MSQREELLILRHEIDRILQDLNGVKDRIELLLLSVGDCVPILESEPDFSGLAQCQQEAILSLRAIKDTSMNGRLIAQNILHQLSEAMRIENLKISEPLVRFIKAEFDRRDREWGVTCLKKGCDEPATLLWMKGQGYNQGGAMSFSHITEGKREIHCGRTTLPLLTVIPKLDKRRNRKK